ncbi:CD63 antigen-like [Anopheles bellator]|uniref:CD63 antigen-like n=1 Tax=Anopheles bellator TaxID=139047 RepID=UPI002648B8E6|nr:CD63 antigen-like [Anopheles bellator]
MQASRRAINLIKYLVLMLSFMCVVIEIIQIVVGAVLDRLFSVYTVFLDNDFERLTHFLIAVGIVLVFLSIFGLVGTIFENKGMIFLYAGIYSVIVILEILIAVTAFSMTSRVDRMLNRRMDNVMERFHTDSFMRASFNHMQNEMNCCGIQSYSDWFEFHPGQHLPNSCCSASGPWTEGYGNCIPHERGCFGPMSDFVSSRIQMVATGTMIIIVFQVVCIISAIVMGFRLMRYQQRGLPDLNSAAMPEPILTEKPKF